MADKNQPNYLFKGVIGPVYKLGSLRPNDLTRARGRNVSIETERFVKRSFKGNARFLVVQKSRPDTFHMLDYPDYEWIHGHGIVKKRTVKDRKKNSVVVVKPEHPTPQ